MIVSKNSNRFFAEIQDHADWLIGPVNEDGLSAKGNRLCVSCDDCRGQSFAGLDLRGAEFYGVHFVGCDFSNSQLNGAVFAGCDLSGANLTGAVLRNATIQDCSFLDSVLAGADFSESILRDIDLRRTGAVASFLGDKFTFVGPTNSSIGCDFTSNVYWREVTRNEIKIAELYDIGLHSFMGANCDWWDQYSDIFLAMVRKSSAFKPLNRINLEQSA